MFEGIGLYIWYALLACGSVGVGLLVPRKSQPGRPLVTAGLVLGAAALAGVLVHWYRWIGSDNDGRLFVITFGAIAVVAAVLLATSRKPVYSALYFVLVMLSVTGLCILGMAEFLGIALVIVYGGAILVTYVFVIMLAQQSGVTEYDGIAREPVAAVVVGFLLMAATTQAMARPDPVATHADELMKEAREHHPISYQLIADDSEGDGDGEMAHDANALHNEAGNVRAVGQSLLNHYVVALEVAGLLLLVAMVGAIAIAQKKIAPAEMTPEEIAHQRGSHEDIRKRGREAPPY